VFRPGEELHPVYRGWGERTVDRQDLESILSSWRLRVDGLVEAPRDYTFADLVALEPRSFLALGIGGNTLPLKHGFPARAVLPRMYAYKSPKYVERIELTDQPIEGFWVKYGYPYDAPVPLARLREGRY